MEFRIADTFTDSLARLTGEEQRTVKVTAFDLQLNPAQPGMRFHKLDQARDPHFLLGPELSDVDGNLEQRLGAISVFNGPSPTIQVFRTPEDESQAVGTWLSDRANEGVMSHEMGVFVRSPAELDRARATVEHAGLPFTVLDEHVETTSDHVSISTMHLAKGLEFRVVVVMACDDEVIPLQARIETVADDADLAEVYNTERHLLYVACTRARDHLLVTSVNPPSEFLDDLRI
jgi:superfamily I DNA/RNA helicase